MIILLFGDEFKLFIPVEGCFGDYLILNILLFSLNND